jgi:hypothetical protein
MSQSNDEEMQCKTPALSQKKNQLPRSGTLKLQNKTIRLNAGETFNRDRSSTQ